MEVFIKILSLIPLTFPGLFLRYYPFKNDIDKDKKKLLFTLYVVIFILEAIIMYVGIVHFGVVITQILYRILVFVGSLPYVITNILLIRGNVGKHLFFFSMQGGSAVSLHTIVTLTIGRTYEKYPLHIQLAIQSLGFLILSAVFIYFMYIIYKDAIVFRSSHANNYYWNIIWLIPTTAVYSDVIVTMNTNQWINSVNPTISRILMTLTLIITWKFLNIDIKAIEDNNMVISTNRLLKLNEESIKKQVKIIKENDEKISILKHDMKHNLAIISSLIKNEKHLEARRLIKEYDTQLNDTKKIYYCKNTIINHTFLTYMSRAEEKSIIVTNKINIPNDIIYDDADMAILFSNAIENAINATSKLDKKYRQIEITAKYEKEKLAINIINTYDGEKIEYINGLPSNHDIGHGYGIKSIMTIINKYGAYISIDHDSDIFTLSCLFTHK